MSDHKIEHLQAYMLAKTFSNRLWQINMGWNFFAKKQQVSKFVEPLMLCVHLVLKDLGTFKENKNLCSHN